MTDPSDPEAVLARRRRAVSGRGPAAAVGATLVAALAFGAALGVGVVAGPVTPAALVPAPWVSAVGAFVGVAGFEALVGRVADPLRTFRRVAAGLLVAALAPPAAFLAVRADPSLPATVLLTLDAVAVVGCAVARSRLAWPEGDPGVSTAGAGSGPGPGSGDDY